MMSKQLKPCPFCGGEDFSVTQSGAFGICCNDCEAEGPKKPDFEEAITTWNTRARKE